MFELLKIMKTFGLVLFCSCLLASANPFRELSGQPAEEPFPGCYVFQLGGLKGLPLTNDMRLQNHSMLAFYPLTETETMLEFNIMFRYFSFKVKVEGSMISLQECSSVGRNCVKKSVEGVKYPDYIKPNHWNKVSVAINKEMLEVHIGPRMVKSMSMVNYRDVKDGYWSVVARSQPVKTVDPNTPDFLYLVQFKCKEYVPRDNDYSSTTPSTTTTPLITTRKHMQYVTTTTMKHYPFGLSTSSPKPTVKTTTTTESHNDDKYPSTEPTTEVHSTVTPAPQIESTPAPSNEGSKVQVGVIVGIVVAIIVLLALGIVLYNVIRKRQSHSMNEKSPFAKDQQQPTK